MFNNELWREYPFNKEYWISNYGRVFSFLDDCFLTPVIKYNTAYYHVNGELRSIRPMLKGCFRFEEIKFDLTEPSKSIYENISLLTKVLSESIGVYRSNTGKPWRYVIQYHNMWFSHSYDTKEEARTGWIKKYCWLYGLKTKEVMDELKISTFPT